MSRFTFHNQGTIAFFNPGKKSTDSRGNVTTLLELHKELVRNASRKDVYILNNRGREVPIEELTT
jgi:hypothetical protein